MGDKGDQNVVVAVRVRPFNQREKDLGAQLAIKMEGPQTTIFREGEDYKFNFDHSYWSFDTDSANFANQDTIFNDVGNRLLANALEGYNCTCLAYGQTGSGKSYSMIGGPKDAGLIPRINTELFKRVSENADPNVEYTVEVSFLEIYNEKISDLLNPKAAKGSLKVRQHPTLGTYVDGLTKMLVRSEEEVNKLMDEGAKVRTIAATNMNAVSSRSHAIFTIIFTQTKTDPTTKKPFQKASRINLVDLAGSERQEQTGATGDRLKEGSAINQSLSCLGNVISVLAENKPGSFVPYRDSTLTWLLKESLGGNSKTVMIAALSPASSNFVETLSTLRYADRAKRIVNKPKVVEDPNVLLIKELRAEIENLKKQLTGQGGGGGGTSTVVAASGDSQALAEQLAQAQALLAEANMSVEEKEKLTKQIQAEREEALKDLGITTGELEKLFGSSLEQPHLRNVSQDPQQAGTLIYFLKPTVTKVGTKSATPVVNDIVLDGLGISPEHCTVEIVDGSVFITALNDSRTFVNGKLVTQKTQLKDGDRLVLGRSFVFHVVVPSENAAQQKSGQSDDDYDKALEECVGVTDEEIYTLLSSYQVILQKKGLSADEASTKVEIIARGYRTAVVQVDEANAISEGLTKPLRLSADLKMDAKKEPKIIVWVYDSSQDGFDFWAYGKFLHRLDLMRSIWADFKCDGKIDVQPTMDPFYDPSDEEWTQLRTSLQKTAQERELLTKEREDLSKQKDNLSKELTLAQGDLAVTKKIVSARGRDKEATLQKLQEQVASLTAELSVIQTKLEKSGFENRDLKDTVDKLKKLQIGANGWDKDMQLVRDMAVLKHGLGDALTNGFFSEKDRTFFADMVRGLMETALSGVLEMRQDVKDRVFSVQHFLASEQDCRGPRLCLILPVLHGAPITKIPGGRLDEALKLIKKLPDWAKTPTAIYGLFRVYLVCECDALNEDMHIVNPEGFEMDVRDAAEFCHQNDWLLGSLQAFFSASRSFGLAPEIGGASDTAFIQSLPTALAAISQKALEHPPPAGCGSKSNAITPAPDTKPRPVPEANDEFAAWLDANVGKEAWGLRRKVVDRDGQPCVRWLCENHARSMKAADPPTSMVTRVAKSGRAARRPQKGGGCVLM